MTVIERLKIWKEEHEPQIKEIKLMAAQIRRNLLSIAGLIIILLITSAALFAPWVATHNPRRVNPDDMLQPPSWKHFFGTDRYGMDTYSRVVWGAQYDLEIAFIVTLATAIMGAFLGLFAGYFGGIVDEIVMRITDIFFAIPGLLIAIAFSAAIGTRSLTTLMIALIFTRWTRFTRIVEAEVLKIKEELYVEAARSLGAGSLRILFRHVLPNSLVPLIVTATTDIGYVILTAAGLSFLGFGAEPGSPEWGRMILEGRDYMFNYPWIVIFPGLALFITVLGFSLLGDGIRDALDPRLRHGAVRK